MPIKSTTFALLEAVQQEMQQNELLSINFEYQGVAATDSRGKTIDLFKEFGYPRVCDTGGPLDEVWLGGSAIGMARAGVPTICHLPSMTQLHIADMLFHQAGMLRYMSGGIASCPIVFWLDAAGRKAGSAGTHAYGGLESMYGHIPGVKIVSPSTAYDAKGLMIAAIRDPDPVCFFQHNQVGEGEVPDEPYIVAIGKTAIREKGKDITIAGVAPATLEIAKAISLLKQEGISPEFIDVRTLKPLDIEPIIASVRQTGKLLTVDHACYSFGPAAEITAEVAENVQGAKIKRLAFADAAIAAAPGMANWMILDAVKIVAAVKTML